MCVFFFFSFIIAKRVEIQAFRKNFRNPSMIKQTQILALPVQIFTYYS